MRFPNTNAQRLRCLIPMKRPMKALANEDMPVMRPILVEMTPEVLILLGATPAEHVGTALNAARANLVRAVLL